MQYVAKKRKNTEEMVRDKGDRLEVQYVLLVSQRSRERMDNRAHLLLERPRTF